MYSASSPPLNLLFNSLLPFPSRRPYFFCPIHFRISSFLFPVCRPLPPPALLSLINTFLAGKGGWEKKFFYSFPQAGVFVCVWWRCFPIRRFVSVDSTFTQQQTMKHKPTKIGILSYFFLILDIFWILFLFWIRLHLFCWWGMFKVFITQLIHKRPVFTLGHLWRRRDL